MKHDSRTTPAADTSGYARDVALKYFAGGRFLDVARKLATDALWYDGWLNTLLKPPPLNEAAWHGTPLDMNMSKVSKTSLLSLVVVDELCGANASHIRRAHREAAQQIN